jgi:hypothetical protein
LERKIFRESLTVATVLLIEPVRPDAVDCGKAGIEDYLLATDGEDERGDIAGGNEFFQKNAPVQMMTGPTANGKTLPNRSVARDHSL